MCVEYIYIYILYLSKKPYVIVNLEQKRSLASLPPTLRCKKGKMCTSYSGKASWCNEKLTSFRVKIFLNLLSWEGPGCKLPNGCELPTSLGCGQAVSVKALDGWHVWVSMWRPESQCPTCIRTPPWAQSLYKQGQSLPSSSQHLPSNPFICTNPPSFKPCSTRPLPLHLAYLFPELHWDELSWFLLRKT